jgi:hypothetical protein
MVELLNVRSDGKAPGLNCPAPGLAIRLRGCELGRKAGLSDERDQQTRKTGAKIPRDDLAAEKRLLKGHEIRYIGAVPKRATSGIHNINILRGKGSDDARS